MQHVINISPTGQISFVYDDALRGLMGAGKATIARASHVEPNADGMWEADLSPVGGPKLGPFTKRTQALRAERDWLHANHFGHHKEHHGKTTPHK